MNHICPKCAEGFTSSEAKCEDWRDKNRSCICPYCNAYLRKDKAKFNLRKLIVTLLGYIPIVISFEVMPKNYYAISTILIFGYSLYFMFVLNSLGLLNRSVPDGIGFKLEVVPEEELN